MKTFIYFNLFTIATASSLRSGKSRNLVAEPVVFEGNPNCKELGFDFGYKVDGCDDAADVTAFSAGYLVLTQMAADAPSDCQVDQVGSYQMRCGQIRKNEAYAVDITPSVDVAVFVKGSTGGNLYQLGAGETFTGLKPPGKYAISHIEYCFRCGDPVVEEEPAAVTEPPAVEETVAEPEPVVEEPAAEPEPAVEEPAAEPEPVVEEPAAEPEPAVEEPAPVENDVDGVLYVEGNPNCKEMGYDFGWKTPDDCTDAEEMFSAGYLEMTQLANGINAKNCELQNVGSFRLECNKAENETKTATITPLVDTVVFIKGGDGGQVYKLLAGETYTA